MPPRGKVQDGNLGESPGRFQIGTNTRHSWGRKNGSVIKNRERLGRYAIRSENTLTQGPCQHFCRRKKIPFQPKNRGIQRLLPRNAPPFPDLRSHSETIPGPVFQFETTGSCSHKPGRRKETKGSGPGEPPNGPRSAGSLGQVLFSGCRTMRLCHPRRCLPATERCRITTLPRPSATSCRPSGIRRKRQNPREMTGFGPRTSPFLAAGQWVWPAECLIPLSTKSHRRVVRTSDPSTRRWETEFPGATSQFAPFPIVPIAFDPHRLARHFSPSRPETCTPNNNPKSPPGWH